MAQHQRQTDARRERDARARSRSSPRARGSPGALRMLLREALEVSPVGDEVGWDGWQLEALRDRGELRQRWKLHAAVSEIDAPIPVRVACRALV